MRSIPFLLSLTLGLFMLLLPATWSAAAPDVTGTAAISSDTAGVWTATKRVDVYAEGNADDPFPADGNFTYVYTVTNDPGSLVALGGFLLVLSDPDCLPASIGFIPGPLDPDVPGGVVNDTGVAKRAEWYFSAGGIAPGATTSQLYLTSDCGPGTMPDQLMESSIPGQFGFDGSGQCIAPTVPPVATGDPVPCTIGFWKNRAAGKKGTLQHFDAAQFDAIVSLGVVLSGGIFADEAALLSDLQSKGNRPPSQRARQQLAALVLDLAAGTLNPDNQKCKLFGGNTISSNACGANMSVDQALDFFFLEYAAGRFLEAKDCADDVNNGIGVGDG